jgi:hypothetical protein
MALSETFRNPAARATRSLIPITARKLVEWTYAVQRAQGVRELTLEPQGRSQTGAVVDRLVDYAALGCRVDVSSNAAAVWGETRCHEDAITVHSIVQAMQPRQRFLLIEHSSQRSAPDWQPKIFPLRCVPVMGRRGSERGIYLGSGRNRVGHELTYEGDWPSRDAADDHKIAADAHMRLWADQGNWPATRRRRSQLPEVAEHDWSPQPYRRCADEVLRRAREEYSAWYEALLALSGGLEASGPHRLQRYRITALGAACQPWKH